MSNSHESLPQVTFIAPDAAALDPLFPGYQFEGLIATGGMGAVYCAIQKSLERTVAIKILPLEFSQNAAFCASFEAEAKAMARLNHPNLIGVYDFGEVNGMLYIIMEYVPGKSLFHSAHGIAIDPAEVARLVTGICNGLAHAHANGIIHRDIKPSNILLDLQAEPKIGDFGLAHPVDRKIKEGDDIFGTPHYTAPEAIHSPQAVDYRADLFSVGVLLHELLTGRLPADDPRPASIISHCDHRFDAIIRRATDPLPDRRYASANEIARDLQAITAATTTRPAKQAPKTGRQASQARPPQAVRGNVKSNLKQQQSSDFPTFWMLTLAAILGALGYLYFSKPPAPRNIITDPEQPAIPAPATTGQPPAPSPTPSPEPSTPTTSEPAPPATPKFDVPGFLVQARKIMLDRAAQVIITYHSALRENYQNCKKTMLYCASRLGAGRDQAKAQLNQYFKNAPGEKYHVPATMDEEIAIISGCKEIHASSIEKQINIIFEREKEISKLTPTYILGLEKQIARLQADNDPAAILLIEEELKRTRDDPRYFPQLMLDAAAAAKLTNGF